MFILEHCTESFSELLIVTWALGAQPGEYAELLRPFLPGSRSISAPLLPSQSCGGWYSDRPLGNWDPQAERRNCSKPLLQIELDPHRFTNEIRKCEVLMI